MPPNPAIDTSEQPVHRPHDENAEDQAAHASDDEPMVYTKTRDYAGDAQRERERLLAAGADPASVVLHSELHHHISRREDESADDYTKRYMHFIEDLQQRGGGLLRDSKERSRIADYFIVSDSKAFDLGPGSGATKGEYRRFMRWFVELVHGGQNLELPQDLSRFEEKKDDVKN